MSRPHRATAFALAALIAVPALAVAQAMPPLQRFQLYKPIPEPAITACRNSDVPIRLNTLMAEGHVDEATAEFETAVHDGKCLNGTGMVTYTRQIHRVDAPDGTVLTVYEASAGGVKFFVPMLGYLHEDTSI
jgi:hypothetical protein